VVRRPASAETTGLGAAFLAGLAEGVWGSTAEVAEAWRLDRVFRPAVTAERERLHAGWKRAVERARDWAR